MQDYYKILGIAKTATNDQIKKAYREAALFWHPDKNKSPSAHDKFILINEAYNILINPNKRQVYEKLYEAEFRIKVDITIYQDTKYEYKTYEGWVKEERVKAEKLATLSVDSVLTDTFYLIDKYWWKVFAIIMAIAFLIAMLSQK